MNNTPYPYFPNPFGQFQEQVKFEEEIKNLKIEIAKLKERLNNLENKKTNDYLKKDDSLYMLQIITKHIIDK